MRSGVKFSVSDVTDAAAADDAAAATEDPMCHAAADVQSADVQYYVSS